jgi:hypothetical protein
LPRLLLPLRTCERRLPTCQHRWRGVNLIRCVLMLLISFNDLVTCYIIAFLSLAMMFLSLASSVQIAFTCLKPKKYIESIWFLCLAVCHVLLTANVVASFSHQKKRKILFRFSFYCTTERPFLGFQLHAWAPSVLIIRLQLQRLHIFYNVSAACIVHVYFTRSCTALFSSL